MSFYSKPSKDEPAVFSLTLDIKENLPILNADENFYNFIEYSKKEFLSLFDNQFLFLLHPSDIVHLNELIFNKTCFDGKEINCHCALITKSKSSKFIRLCIKFQNTNDGSRIILATIFDVSSEVCSFTLPSFLEAHFNFLDNLTENYYFNLDLLTGNFTSTKKFADLIFMPSKTFIFPNALIENNLISIDKAQDIFNKQFEKNLLYYNELRLNTVLEEKIFLMKYKVHFNAENTPVHIIGKLMDITNKSLDLNSIADNKKFDSLTLLFNKNISYDLIRNYLKDKSEDKISALMLIDLKNFNLINDKFGTIYGDAILSEYANLLKQTFRNIDIVARIGGDDFLVFIKDCPNQNLILQKANKIHKLFTKPLILDEKEFEVRAEIGIAISSKNSNLQTLLNKASLALEKTKELAKKSSDKEIFYTIYGDTLDGSTFESKLSKINEHKSSQQNFSRHMQDYVFNLLYNSADFNSAIQSVLHLLTDHFKFSSSFITEFSDDVRFLNCEYSWNKDNTLSNLFKNVSVTDFLFLTVPIISSGSLILDSKSEIDEGIANLLNNHSTRSLIAFSLIDNGKTIGFISFTSDSAIADFTQEQLQKLENAAKIISVFLSKHNAKALNHKIFLDNIKS